ncbi:MAG: DUF305 domain-containing protein [Actinobacteria bacterium]|nr:DUF305 domain-containing protein [Actinomycetota bacterium]
MSKPRMIAAGVAAFSVALVLAAASFVFADDDKIDGDDSASPTSVADNPVTSGVANDEGSMANMIGMVGPDRAMGQMDAMAAMNVESEFEYLTRMIPHHEEAIASATILRDGTESPEIRAFARQIIETQSAELSQIEAWLATWYPERDTAAEYTPMMRDLSALRGDDLDRAFLEDMIPHHMAAVMMSQQVLSGGLVDNDEVEPFAETIRNTQRAEIIQMANWLTERFGA